MPAPTSTIGNIRVLEPLGEGGMGEVFAGFDEKLQRRCALKMIKPTASLRPEAKQRFLREARILSRLDHPNICRIHEILEGESGDVLVLELVEGIPLGAAIRRGLARADQLRIASQIASVLVVAHAEGVVHRDLKPANVMVTRDGNAKVLDFGLARSTEDSGPLRRDQEAGDGDLGGLLLSQEGRIAGTPGYMSPEQARGETITPASDMYSFGLLLQELLTGRPPFEEGLSIQALLARALDAQSVPVAGLGAELTSLVNDLKSSSPGERPTALETAQRLQRIVDAPRRRLRRAALAAAVAVTVLAVAKYTVDLRRERRAALVARDEAVAARGQAEELVEFMLDDLYRSLEPVGRLELLDKVARRALSYYLAAGDQPRPSAADQPAIAVRRIAEVLELQGQLAEALEALTRSEAMYRRLLDDGVAGGDVRAGYAATLVHSGELLATQGDLNAAVGSIEDGISIARSLVEQDPAQRDWQLALARGETALGVVLAFRGEMKESVAAHQRALPILERLVAADPARSDWLYWLAKGCANLGDTLEVKGDLAEALAAQRRSLALFEKLSEQRPSNARWRDECARVHHRIGSVLEAQGDSEGALAAYGRALEIGKRLVLEDTSNARWRSLLANYYSRLGRALQMSRRQEEAHEAYRQAVAMYGELSRLNPTSADWKNNLAWNLVLEGRSHRALGRPQEARADWERAVEIIAGAAHESQDVYLLDTLLAALLELGRVEEARPIAEQLLREGWSDPGFLEACRRHGIGVETQP